MLRLNCISDVKSPPETAAFFPSLPLYSAFSAVRFFPLTDSPSRLDALDSAACGGFALPDEATRCPLTTACAWPW